ncbi:MAG: hypothetical protein QXL69_04405 [Candidatus Bathyarchaeia archaeon]|nr:hypothetical protein [Candidatus Bathyarchaeota archaeon]
MVIRIKVRLTSIKGGEVVASAIANSGFESDEPEIIVPETIAEKLKLYPKFPEGVEVEEYKSVGGKFKAYRIKGFVKAWALSEDKSIGPVNTVLTIVPDEDEILLSDKLIDALSIELIRPGEGLWKFRDDKTLRKSVPPERF